MAGWAQDGDAALELLVCAGRELAKLQNDHELLRIVIVIYNGKATSPEEETVENEAIQRFWKRPESYQDTPVRKKVPTLISNLLVEMNREIARLGGTPVAGIGV